MRTRNPLVCLLIMLACLTPAFGQPTTPATQSDASQTPVPPEFVRLRDELNAAYNRGDVDGMLKYLHPDVVIIFPDGELLQGRDALRGYYDRMLKGPSPVVKSYTADPVVDGRQMRDDVDLSWGRLNDNYVLTDGTAFGLNSRFTVTLIKSSTGPAETDGWLIRSFHSSTDAFDNAVLNLAIKRTFLYGSVGGGVVGLIVGGLAVGLVRRHKRRQVGI